MYTKQIDGYLWVQTGTIPKFTLVVSRFGLLRFWDDSPNPIPINKAVTSQGSAVVLHCYFSTHFGNHML
jgi:hypothetical protein